jgi:hypothetical protein
VGFGFEVEIEDTYGNLETSDTATLTASLKTGTGPLSGTLTAVASNGIATFTNLIDDKAETLTISFAGTGLTSATSASIVIGAAPASKLVIQTQPSSTATVGVPFAIQPVIDEEDPFGNIETGDKTTVVTVSLGSGPGPLSGAMTAVVSGGVARFAALADKKVETATLQFSSGSLSKATSNSVIIGKETPTLSFAASRTTATYKQAITLNAVVSAPAGGTSPTGSVTFLDGSTVLGSATLNGTGAASLTTSSLPLGTQSISVSYSGDSSNAAIKSGTSPLYVGDLPNDDFDGDGKSDVAVYGYNPTYKEYGFTINTSSSGFGSTIFYDHNGYGYGNAQSVPVPGDYFGDGRDAYALWTPNNVGGMTFTAISSLTGKSLNINFGSSNDIPVVADIDGDGKDDFGIYGNLPGHGWGFDFLLSSDNFNANDQSIFNNNGYGFGNAQSIPIVADFDGSGKAGFGVYNASSSGATFAFVDPSIKYSLVLNISPSLTTSKDIPMAVEADGDGKADLALYGPSPTNPNVYRYLVLTSSTGYNPSKAVVFNNNGYGYGNAQAIPIMADYDGTGKDDFAVYMPIPGAGFDYFFQTSQTGPGVIESFPSTDDLPLATSPAFLAKKVLG